MSVRRVESRGSIWEIDEVLMRYRRFPREEKPREDPSWGGPDAGALQDFAWHEFTSWRFDPTWNGWALVIEVPGPEVRITAPMPAAFVPGGGRS